MFSPHFILHVTNAIQVTRKIYLPNLSGKSLNANLHKEIRKMMDFWTSCIYRRLFFLLLLFSYILYPSHSSVNTEDRLFEFSQINCNAQAISTSRNSVRMQAGLRQFCSMHNLKRRLQKARSEQRNQRRQNVQRGRSELSTRVPYLSQFNDLSLRWIFTSYIFE